MSIPKAPVPRIDDLDAIAQMEHVKAFQLTTTRRDSAVACGWRAVVNDRRAAGALPPVVPEVVPPTPEYLARMKRIEAEQRTQRAADRRNIADHVEWYGRLPDPITFK